MRIAALDLGSNSFHLLVADVRPDGTFEPVTREKEMLRLGDEVSRHGYIRAAAADRVVASVRRMAQLASAHGAREVIAKATSAIRTAANGSEVVDHIEAETGVEVEVISGDEEARLIFAAVRASIVIDTPPAVCLDIGGGSMEVMVGDAAGLRWATSLPLGVGRLTAELIHDDPPSKRERKALEARITAVLEPAVEQVTRREPGMAIGSSGTLTDLARMATAYASGDLPPSTNGLRVTLDELRAQHDRIIRMKTSERRRLTGLEESRAELIVAGSTLAILALEQFGCDELITSDWALREGMVLDTVRTHDPADWSDDPQALRRSAVLGLARRCNSDLPHTQHVADLALQLFDQTVDVHRLGPTERELLEYAAILHDIGQHVSRKGHHRHAAYLVEHADLRGFSPEEVAFLAALVRHHRRGEPKASEPRFAALSDEQRERVRYLAALLRVADGLDRGRRGGVDAVAVDVGPHLAILRLSVHDDAELELWGARRRRELFERVFGREVEFVVREPARSGRATEPPI